MYARKPRYHLLLLLLLVLLAAGGLTGTAVAKYITQNTAQGSVTFSAQLAESLTLWEHEAAKNADGLYTIDATSPTIDSNDETKNGNTYSVVIPGLDIPKDPQITVKGKTDIPAYLFLEIVGHQPGENDKKVTYTLEDCWVKQEDIPGTSGGTVYVYSANNSPAEVTGATFSESDTINIIKGQKVYVSQALPRDTELTITLYACMSEAVSGKTLKEIYEAAYPNS